MELIQRRQRNCLMVFFTWPIAPAPGCSKFLLIFGKIIIIIIIVFFSPAIDCSTSPTYGTRRNVGRALGWHFLGQAGKKSTLYLQLEPDSFFAFSTIPY
jgi:hypothetical protein